MQKNGFVIKNVLKSDFKQQQQKTYYFSSLVIKR